MTRHPATDLSEAVHELESLLPPGWRYALSGPGPYVAVAFNPNGLRDVRGYGPDPAAALSMLADRLVERLKLAVTA